MNKTIKPVSLAIGAAFVGTFALSQSAFAMSDLDQGYMQSAQSGHVAGVVGEGKCGEGKCGGDAEKEGGEGKCGEGKCGGDAEKEGGEGKCGEG
ncbi:MAG TPA: hypothetical protein DDZ76_06550, partial [Xanthomonadales bacterium]|nr:hypothetical protein [Xanthomonadales bacterium]